MELSIRKLHLINDLMFTGLRRVVDSFDPYDWIIVCTIRTIDLSIRKLHSLTAKSETSRHNTWPIQVWVCPKHEGRSNPWKHDFASVSWWQVLVLYTLGTRNKQNTETMQISCDYPSFFRPQNIRFWRGANSLHPVFTTNMYLSGVRLMAQRSAETTKAWHCLVHNWWQLLVLSVLPGGFFKRSLSCTLNDWNLNALGGVDAIVISICWNFHYIFHYLLFLTMLAVLV